MKLFTIHFNNDSFLYEQLYEYIVEKIYDKTLKPGSRLPSKKKLAKHLNISENTVDKAYTQLLVEGYIYSVERSGHFVEKLQLPIRPVKTLYKSEEKVTKKKYKYDFSYAGVDREMFDTASFEQPFKEVSKEISVFTQRSLPEGSLNLRQSIIDYLFSSRGFSCSINQMIISSGTEYLYQLLFNLVKKSSVFGLEDPGYQRIAKYIGQTDFKYIPIPLDNDGVNIDELIDKKIDLVTITPSHQFPSGIIYPMKKRLELLKWAKDYDGFIIEDDYDSEFRYRGKPIPALKSVDVSERVIYMGSFSKSFSPGLRISYMILPEDLISKYEKIKNIYPCPVSNFTQEAFAKWMAKGEFYKHLNKTRTHYKQKMELIIKCIENSDMNLKMYGMDSGLHMILEINEDVDTVKLKENLNENKIKIEMLDNYYYNKKLKNPTMLLGFSVIPIDEIEMAMSALLNSIKTAKKEVVSEWLNSDTLSFFS